MSEPLDPPAPGVAFGYHSLDWCRRRGVQNLSFWCVGGHEKLSRHPCTHWQEVPVAVLIGKLGPGLSLVMLARRARCAACGKRGCHVELVTPPGSGQPGYREWIEAERARCRAFLAATGEI